MAHRKKVVKVPVVMQMEALECGAACLKMILEYYGKVVPLEKVRLDCGVSRDGSNARNMLKAARSYGLEASGYRFEPEDLMENGSFPCIIHWNFNHFVVLCGFKGNKAVLNDPGNGHYSVSMEEFDKSFTGICLFFKPTAAFVKNGKRESMLHYASRSLAGAGSAFVFVLITMIIASLVKLIDPAFSRILVDRLLTGENPDWFAPFMASVCVIYLINFTLTVIKLVWSLRIDGRLAAIGSTKFMWKLLSLPMEFFSQRFAGDLQQRAASNSKISSTLVNTLAPLILNTVMMIVYLFIMSTYSWQLTLIGVSAVILNVFVSRLISKKRVNITRVQMRDEGKLISKTFSGLAMMESIKASGAENGYFESWAGYQAGVNSQKVHYAKLEQYLGMLPGLITSLTNLIILVIGVYLTIEGHFTAGMIMAFQGFLTLFMEPATMLINAGQVLQEMRTDMERIEDVMKYPSEVDFAASDSSDEEAEADKLSGNIEVRDLSFGYSRLDKPLIEGFNLTVRPGQKIAIVGSSGCGKSTISKLISGLYKPWSGEILFDGKKISEIDRSIFTGSLAVVDQDIILFEDTIASNIKMWDTSIEDFEMIMAARDARLHEDIMQREGGYQYRITEGGKDFSGGQRQRLEIARVLAQDPTIIIMDEATSALDAKTEQEVVKAVNDRGITCIVIAHRLSTIRDCDEIIVMDSGKIVERGTHDELLANGGYYTRLVSES